MKGYFISCITLLVICGTATTHGRTHPTKDVSGEKEPAEVDEDYQTYPQKEVFEEKEPEADLPYPLNGISEEKEPEADLPYPLNGISEGKEPEADLPYPLNDISEEKEPETYPVKQVPEKADPVEVKKNIKNVKKVAVATLISGAKLGFNVLKYALNAIGNVKRKIAIGVDNESGCTWTALGTHFYSGTSDKVLPHEVQNTKALMYNARKHQTFHGTVGVFTYRLCNSWKTLAILFSVPYNRWWYKNWWNVKIYHGVKRPNHSIYKDLYYRARPFRGNNHWYHRNLGHGLKVKGFMTNSGQAILEIRISKA